MTDSPMLTDAAVEAIRAQHAAMPMEERNRRRAEAFLAAQDRDALALAAVSEFRRCSLEQARGVVDALLGPKPPAPDDGCRCWNEGQWGRVHREDCSVHRPTTTPSP